MALEDERRTPEQELWDLLMMGDDAGVKLEIAGGNHIWEAFPGVTHQGKVFEIQRSIGPIEGGAGCGCFQFADIYILFLDGSVRRPDISIFCSMPVQKEEFVITVPEAVIEVVSKRYERKDFEFGTEFYLSQGVKDVVVVDPRSGRVQHARQDGVRTGQSPMSIELECGCVCTV